MPAATHRIPVKHFLVDATLACGQTFRWAPAESFETAAERLAGGSAPAGMDARGHGTFVGVVGDCVYRVKEEHGSLEVRTEPPASRSEVERYLRLDDPYARMIRRIAKDPLMRRATGAFHGLRLLRQDPEEMCLSFLLSPASNIPRITRTLHAIARTLGAPIMAGGAVFHRLPRFRELGTADAGTFRRLGAGFRARNIAGFLRTVSAERLNLAALRGRPLEEIREVLVALPGIGPKVADCIALFALDALGAFPVDVWVRRAVTTQYLGGRRLTDRVIGEWATTYFGELAGFAQQFLYHAARTGLLPTVAARTVGRAAPAPPRSAPTIRRQSRGSGAERHRSPRPARAPGRA